MSVRGTLIYGPSHPDWDYDILDIIVCLELQCPIPPLVFRVIPYKEGRTLVSGGTLIPTHPLFPFTAITLMGVPL